MKRFVLLGAMLMLCASAVKTEEETQNSDSPTLEWNLRLMKREFSEGTQEFFKSGFEDYLKHRKDFKEFAGLTILTEGFRASTTKASSEMGSFTFSVIPYKNGEEDAIKLFGGILKRGKERIYPRIIYTNARTAIEKSFGKEMILITHAHATNDDKNPNRLLNIEARVWVLLVNKTNSDIAKLAKDSLPIPDKPPFLPAEPKFPIQLEFHLPQPTKEKKSEKREISPAPTRKEKQPGP